MKKEYFLITAAAFFILAYVFDYLAGPVIIPLKETNPFAFLAPSYLNNYPLTAVSVVIRSLGIFICAAFISTMLKKQYFLKFIAALIVGVLAELYAIQQIATGVSTTPLQWTLSIAYAGGLLGILVVFYLFVGAAQFIKQKLVGESCEEIEVGEKHETGS